MQARPLQKNRISNLDSIFLLQRSNKWSWQALSSHILEHYILMIPETVFSIYHMSSPRLFMDRPRASIVFASQQHCKSCISDPSQVKLSLAISTAAAVGFTHKCFVVSEWVHAAAWALTNTRLQVSSLVYPVLHYETLLRIWVLVYFDPKSKLF